MGGCENLKQSANAKGSIQIAVVLVKYGLNPIHIIWKC